MRFVVLLMLVLMLPCVFAIGNSINQPQQSYSKMMLQPYYRASMAQNTNYTYNVTVMPPDGISSVRSAIITIEAYLTPTVTFTLWVNGQSCNNPTYVVSTTFAAAGRGVMSFDCSNVITKEGTYTVTIRSTSANVGANTAYLDIVYMTKPKGSLEVKGTEYYENDDGTIFLQLLDENGVGIDNAVCDISIHYPNTDFQVKPYWVQNALMQFLDDGIYYYDFITPTVSGVYIPEAECTYTVTNADYYADGEFVKKPIRTAVLGTFTGDSVVLNSYTDWLYTQCDSSSGTPKTCEAIYEYNVSGANVSDMYLNYMGESGTAPTLTFYGWNWSSSAWVALPNTLTFKGTAPSGPSGVDEYVSNKFPNVAQFKGTNGTVRVRTVATAGATFKLYSNWLSIRAVEKTTQVQNLKGSGEIHVTSVIPDSLASRFYRVTTCDGDTDGRCGTFVQGTEGLFEGEIWDIINLTAVSSRMDTFINYETPFTTDCSALLGIDEWNGTEWIEHTDHDSYSNPVSETCNVQIFHPLNSGEESSFRVRVDNYMKWDLLYNYNYIMATKPQADNFCLGRNVTYEVPLTNDTYAALPTQEEDPITRYCWLLYDDYYYADSFHNDSLSVDTVKYYSPFVSEMRYYAKGTAMKLQFLAQYENTTLMPQYIWKYANRSLTQNITVTATVDSGALDNISNAVWSYTNRSAQTDTLFVGGTEYAPLTPGKIAARVISNGNPVASAVCTVNIAYPNMTLWTTNGAMTEYTNIGNGVYVYNFTAPNVTGVYTYAVDCTKGGSKYYLLDTFHVENVAQSVAEGVWSYTGTIGSNILNQITQAISDFYGAVLQMVS